MAGSEKASNFVSYHFVFDIFRTLSRRLLRIRRHWMVLQVEQVQFRRSSASKISGFNLENYSRCRMFEKSKTIL